MWKLLKAQCDIIINKKFFLFSFMFIMTCVILNFFYNIYLYYGSDFSELIAFPEISLLGSNNISSYFFLKVYPFLLVFPAGFSLAEDKASSIELLWIQRSGRIKYYMSKLIAVFVMTFLCFFIPLVFETILNMIAFCDDTHGNLYGYGLYTNSYEYICNYPFFNLYYNIPALYSSVMAFLFGIVTASLATFPSAISCLFSKYKAYLLIPIYLFLYSADVLGIWGKTWISKNKVSFTRAISWCEYSVGKEQFINIILVCGVIFIFSAILYYYTARKDTL